MNNKTITIASLLVGVCFLGLAGLYFMTPAGALPTFVPGFIEGSDKIHLKHGMGALLLAAGLFALAWFKSAPPAITSETTE